MCGLDDEKGHREGEPKERCYGSEAGSDLDNEPVNDEDPFFEAGKDPQQKEEGQVHVIIFPVPRKEE